MIRLQQYERLLKAIVAHHELAAPFDALEAQRDSRIASVATKSLGQMVKALFDTYAVPEGFQREVLAEDQVPPDRMSLGLSIRIEMPPERLASVRAGVDALVAMRNELVHHLIERFDLWSDEGCEAAARHLEQCYQLVDQHYAELVGWAKSMEEAKATFGALVKSEALQNELVNQLKLLDGIARDGSVDWPNSSIVRILRAASKTFSENGWTRLDQAYAWAREAHPEQTPARYGCRSWPQVLQNSKLFDLAYRRDDNGQKIGWFRER